MPRVHFVKKARKAQPGSEIKKGDSYYWWKFRRGGKRVSVTRPKQSQLTQSEFWGAIYSLQEANETTPSFEVIENSIEEVRSGLEDIKGEIEDKISNMEEAFPNGCPVLETLQERQEALESTISDLESVDTSIDYGEIEDEASDEAQEARDQRAEEIWQEVTEALGNISCS